MFLNALLTFLISMLPVVELRGGIPFGILRDLPEWLAVSCAIAGNIVPIPFILLFVRRILRWLRIKTTFLGKIADKLENRAIAKSGSLKYRSELLALMIFVAIPLPGTGAWTGALIAAVLKMRIRSAFPAIALGVIIAAVIMTVFSIGLSAVINQADAAGSLQIIFAYSGRIFS